MSTSSEASLWTDVLWHKHRFSRWSVFTVGHDAMILTALLTCAPAIFMYHEKKRVNRAVKSRCVPKLLKAPALTDLAAQRHAVVTEAMKNHPHQVLVLVGEEGAGKTTLVRDCFQKHDNVVYVPSTDATHFAETLADILDISALYKPSIIRKVMRAMFILPQDSVADSADELLAYCLKHLERAALASRTAPTLIVEVNNDMLHSQIVIQLEAFAIKAATEGFLKVILVKNKQFPANITLHSSLLASHALVVEVPDLTADQAWEYLKQQCSDEQLAAYPEEALHAFMVEWTGGRMALIEELVMYVRDGLRLDDLRTEILTRCQNVFEALAADGHIKALGQLAVMLLYSKTGSISYQEAIDAIRDPAICRVLLESKVFSFHNKGNCITFSSQAFHAAAKEVYGRQMWWTYM